MSPDVIGKSGATAPLASRWAGVQPVRQLTPLDPSYPARLRGLARPPACLTVQGGSLEATHAIAVVGSRDAAAEAADFARALAAALVAAGAVVVSGGASGIDAAAHLGALGAGGRTWAVAGTSCDRCYPAEHAGLFAQIASGPGAMIWPFASGDDARRGRFLARNRILVALSDAVVVVQAGLPSGALRAAAVARALGRPLWVVPAPPWVDGFDGSRVLLEQGVRPLTRMTTLLKNLGLAPTRSRHLRASSPDESSPDEPDETERDAPSLAALSGAERAVLSVMTTTPSHVDAIARAAHIPAQAAGSALLTLALEAVVVEGPPGFFRRQDARNH